MKTDRCTYSKDMLADPPLKLNEGSEDFFNDLNVAIFNRAGQMGALYLLQPKVLVTKMMPSAEVDAFWTDVDTEAEQPALGRYLRSEGYDMDDQPFENPEEVERLIKKHLKAARERKVERVSTTNEANLKRDLKIINDLPSQFDALTSYLWRVLPKDGQTALHLTNKGLALSSHERPTDPYEAWKKTWTTIREFWEAKLLYNVHELTTQYAHITDCKGWIHCKAAFMALDAKLASIPKKDEDGETIGNYLPEPRTHRNFLLEALSNPRLESNYVDPARLDNALNEWTYEYLMKKVDAFYESNKQADLDWIKLCDLPRAVSVNQVSNDTTGRIPKKQTAQAKEAICAVCHRPGHLEAACFSHTCGWCKKIFKLPNGTADTKSLRLHPCSGKPEKGKLIAKPPTKASQHPSKDDHVAKKPKLTLPKAWSTTQPPSDAEAASFVMAHLSKTDKTK